MLGTITQIYVVRIILTLKFDSGENTVLLWVQKRTFNRIIKAGPHTFKDAESAAA